MRNLYVNIVAYLILVLFGYQYSFATNNVSYSENEVKVAFLFRSLQYVKWENVIEDPDAPISICSNANTDLTSLLNTLNNRTVVGRKIIIASKAGLSDFDTCNVVYIQADSLTHFKSLIHKLSNRQVLTVNDNPDYSQYGGILNFITRDQRISIEVNLKMARKANIVFSAKYLRIAKIIENGN